MIKIFKLPVVFQAKSSEGSFNEKITRLEKEYNKVKFKLIILYILMVSMFLFLLATF